MKLTIKQVETRMKEAWGRNAVVVPQRISGNRYRYAVTDHDWPWLPLFASWEGGIRVFELAGTAWPEPCQSHGWTWWWRLQTTQEPTLRTPSE